MLSAPQKNYPICSKLTKETLEQGVKCEGQNHERASLRFNL